MRSKLKELLGNDDVVDKILSCLSLTGCLSSSFLMRKFKINFAMAQSIMKIIEKGEHVSRVKDCGLLLRPFFRDE